MKKNAKEFSIKIIRFNKYGIYFFIAIAGNRKLIACRNAIYSYF
ncbi:hypothetical protein HNQ71_003429 [Mesorhizobium sangaii]|uniref:Uncharacterized protein n=1 Tax=Mesorhizobium sangaii TaxID=505389 RepID=A0A841PQR6_9HYPH|nr:hypothetical protein [Mesorhizobium sangaii]